MSDQNTTADSLNINEFDKPKLPTGLNILTILTFIGCALQLVGVLFSFFGAKKNFDERDKMLSQISSGEMPAWAKSMMPDPAHYEEMVTKTYENRLPLLLLGLIAVGLCFYGALQMRKLKKQGFMLYIVGQILPFITQALFIGMFVFAGVGFGIGIGLTLLFILLYVTQRKHLIY
ncbi:MAG: hypothetical protein H7Y86_00055 [Rhizobacter sp.]|nr:hypothetical protein [Ferruginibacter sp.]